MGRPLHHLRAGICGAALWAVWGPAPAVAAHGSVAEHGGRNEALYRKLEVLAEVLGQIDTHYVDAVAPTELIYGAVRGAITALDPHSSFFSPEEYKGLLDATEGEYAGLGLEIELKGTPEIVTVFPDSPAAHAGVLPGDQLIKVDGQEVGGMNFEAIERLLRGPVDSHVILSLRRSKVADLLQIKLTRGWVRVAPLAYRALEEGIVYVQLKTFSRRVATDLKTLLDKRVPKKGLVLDLRGNPGGLFDEAVSICDMFLEDGLIVSVVGRNGAVLEKQMAQPGGTQPHYRIAVLIDNNSASAAEIVAGALHDHGRARLFGKRSFGKGSVQSILDLTDGSGLKLTVARYMTPSGKSIDGHGIDPDEATVSPDNITDDDETVQAARKYLRAP